MRSSTVAHHAHAVLSIQYYVCLLLVTGGLSSAGPIVRKDKAAKWHDHSRHLEVATEGNFIRLPLIHGQTDQSSAETIFLKYTKDSLSARPGLKILYGVLAGSSQEHRERVQGQVDTWASDIVNQGRFVVLSGSGSNASADPTSTEILNPRRHDIASPVACSQEFAGIPCKESYIMKVGFETDADWLVVLGDDNYINTSALESKLAESSSSRSLAEPAVFGSIGCGQGNSGHGKIICPEVKLHGGYCGGSTWIVNRGAMHKLFSNGFQHLKQDYETFAGTDYDLASSCVMYKHSIPLLSISELASPFLVSGCRVSDESSIKGMVLTNTIVYHYIYPGSVMHWLHASVNRAPSNVVQELREKAFEKGCCCWHDDDQRQRCINGTLTGCY